MESVKDEINKDINALSYLAKLDEGMIWDSYKEAVPMAIAEVVPANY